MLAALSGSAESPNANKLSHRWRERNQLQSRMLVGFEYGNYLFRSVFGQPPVLKLGVMAAILPLQDFRSVLQLIAGRTVTDYRDYLLFRHSGLESSKPFVHLAANAQQHDNCQK